jgi:hypothetical protein
VAHTAFWDALRTMVEKDAVLFDGVNVTAEPLSFACADLVEDLRVDHGSFGEEALVDWGNVSQVAVKDEAKDCFGDPG